MKRSKFTEQQIMFALKQAETGVSVAEVCRKLGISEATFYNWGKTMSVATYTVNDGNSGLNYDVVTAQLFAGGLGPAFPD
ncbi:MAG: transposase, partial [Acidobacteriota bacterium]